MNVKLLRKVQKHILEEPKRFVMSEGLRFGDAGEEVNVGGAWGDPVQIEVPKCGTVGCIAGWTCVLGDKTWKKSTFAEMWPSIKGTASDLLNVDSMAATKLFAVDSWPEKFALKYIRSKTRKSRAKIASARIDHFIKTKGAE